MTTRAECECEHPRILDDGRWLALAFIGFQPATSDPEGPVLELRDCSRCGSTRARPVPSLRYMLRTINHYVRLRRAMSTVAHWHRCDIEGCDGRATLHLCEGHRSARVK